jgi:C4-dicarboxylate transporter DctM subunit
MIVFLVFLIMAVLMMLYVPISISIGLAMVVGVLIRGTFPLMTFVQRMLDGVNSFTLIAIPLFILTGQLMSVGGVTNDLLRLSRALVGFMRGGLGYVNIVSSMFFAGVSGSCVSDTASLGSILIPAMQKEGYDTEYSVSITCCSSVVGIIIPPSIPMVIYATAANVSIPRLFFGGFIPGVLVSFSLMAINFIYSKKNNYPRSERMPVKEVVKSIVKGIPALMTVVLLLGGIMSGVFTPTEAAAIAVVYALVLGLFYYREIKLKQIPKIMLDVAVSTGMVALMMATATCLGYLFAVENLPRQLSEGLLTISSNKYVILFLINILLLFVGLAMDLGPSIVIFAPMLLPVVNALGIDPVHFGLIMVVNLGIGVVSPPAGGCLFIACAIGKVSISQITKPLIPPMMAMVIALMVITYIPETVLWLPNLIFGQAVS